MQCGVLGRVCVPWQCSMICGSLVSWWFHQFTSTSNLSWCAYQHAEGEGKVANYIHILPSQVKKKPFPRPSVLLNHCEDASQITHKIHMKQSRTKCSHYAPVFTNKPTEDTGDVMCSSWTVLCRNIRKTRNIGHIGRKIDSWSTMGAWRKLSMEGGHYTCCSTVQVTDRCSDFKLTHPQDVSSQMKNTVSSEVFVWFVQSCAQVFYHCIF
jgi:hypothetical protein